MFINRLFSSFGHVVQQGRSHMRLARLLLVGAVAFSAVASSQTALAAKPQIFTFLDEGCSNDLIDCGSFMARIIPSLRGLLCRLRPGRQCNKRAGPPRCSMAHLPICTTGYSLPENGHGTIMFDNQAGTHKVVGLSVRVSISGGGVAILQSGNLPYGPDGVKFAGNHHWADGPDFLTLRGAELSVAGMGRVWGEFSHPSL